MRQVFVFFIAVFCLHAAHAEADIAVPKNSATERPSDIGTVDALMVAQADSANQSADDPTAAAIIAAGTAIDDAFANGDSQAIRALLIPGHVSVTPYYDGPQSVDGQIGSLSDFQDYEQTIVGEPSVQMLSPDVGLKSFIANLKGTFKGKPFPERVFVGQVMVKRNGKWIGGFYQVTTLKP